MTDPHTPFWSGRSPFHVILRGDPFIPSLYKGRPGMEQSFYCHPWSNDASTKGQRCSSVTNFFNTYSAQGIWTSGVGTFWISLQPPSSLIGKVLALVMSLSVWFGDEENRIVQTYFSAAFDRVTYQGILFKLCSMRVGGSVLSVLTRFPSNQSQYVVVDGCLSKLINAVLGVPQGSILGPQLFIL